MLKFICICDRCGRNVSMSGDNRPIRGATFNIPIVSIYNNILENAREVSLCADCIKELNTDFLQFSSH